jgi:two-component system sensor histidine kinase UhpB
VAWGVSRSLGAATGLVVLSVVDVGRGVAQEALHDFGGVGGMRERAMLVGGRLDIGRGPAGGTQVRLEVPTT